MSSTDHNNTNLFNRLLEGELSPQDTDDIIAWLGKEELDSDTKELIVAQLKQFVDPEKISPQVILALEAKLPAIFRLASEEATVASSDQQSNSIEIASENRVDNIRPAHRIHFLKTAWFRYAAAILIVFGSVAYLWINNRNDKDLAAATDNKRLSSDVGPGGEKAVLTLADGRKIILDSAANGNLAQQGNAQIVKLSNGQLTYNLKGSSSKEIMWNTMATPKGGQYQLTLPDDTKVWLNAASSITYPAVFVGNKREVKIAGEVYFEVAKNKQKPFVVDVDEKSLVEALGTSFNINSYTDEESIKTTLLEGSVRVLKTNTTATATSPGLQPKSSEADDKLKGAVILKPGQQATIAVVASADSQLENTAGISIVNNPDIEKTLAWKNGLFNFNGVDLYALMRQLERWYDIKVQYQGSVPNVIFKGEMYRNVNLSDVLAALQKMGVKFRMDGKTLIVLPATS